MTPYKLSQSDKAKFKRSAIRLLRELILADAVIDNEELRYFEAYSQSYGESKLLLGELDSNLYRFGFTAQDNLDATSLVWTAERIENLRKGIDAINNGRTHDAVLQFGQLAMSSGVSLHMLPDVIEHGLEKLHLDSNVSRKATSWVKNNELAIANYVTSH